MKNTYTYHLICECESKMEMNIMHELDYISTCLFCNKFMTISYSINPDGEIWMNSALLDKEEIPYWGYDEGGEA